MDWPGSTMHLRLRFLQFPQGRGRLLVVFMLSIDEQICDIESFHHLGKS
jgi:hypothetical protein